MARVLIVEENLVSVGGGHFWDFARDLMAAAKNGGHEFSCAAHITAEDAIRVEGVYPVLSHGRRARLKGQWGSRSNAADFLVNNYHCYREILRHLKSHGSVDCLFFPTACHYSLFAAWALLCFHPRLAHKAVIFFVQQPTWWPEGAASPQPDKITPILRFALRLLRPLLLEKRAVLATETPVAQEEYRAMTGLDVHLWGHPVEVPARTAKARTGKTLFSSFGFARHEKGSDILAEAIERCLQDPRFDHCEFFLQWGNNFKMSDGSLQTLSPKIRGHQRVRVSEGPLSRRDYLELLEQTDAVLLPYRHTSYYGRLSRVSIEAVAAGIPMIVSPGTHAAHVVAEQGAGVTMSSLSAGELVEGMARFLEVREKTAEMAIQRSASARLIHSPHAFVRDLLVSVDIGQEPVSVPLCSRTRPPFLMSFREFKFCLKQTLRKGPLFLWWYLWARSVAVSGWRNPWRNLPLEKVPLHVMTGADQLPMTKCMLISFFEKTRRNWKVVLHDDGTLSEDAVRALGVMGIQSEYISRSALLNRARQVLSDLPLCRRACEETLLAPKFFGPLIFANAPKIFLLDSDVVFFTEPRELLGWADSESEEMFFAIDRVDRAKLLRVPLREKFGIDLMKSLNSGICCICPRKFKFEDTEKFLRELDLLQTLDPWLIEQTLFAIHSSAGCQGGLLPTTYELTYSPTRATDCVARHYVGGIRELFYTEAVPLLAASRKAARKPARGTSEETVEDR